MLKLRTKQNKEIKHCNQDNIQLLTKEKAYLQWLKT